MAASFASCAVCTTVGGPWAVRSAEANCATSARPSAAGMLPLPAPRLGLQRRARRSSRCGGRRVAAGVAGAVVAEVKYVNSGEEAKKLVDDEGFTIVDIRDNLQYERAHIPSAVHIPYFIKNEDNDIATIVNRQLHNNFSGLFYGLAYTKENPAFVSTILEKFPKDSKLLLMCNGGLRSGYASGKLKEQGYENLAYLSPGMQSLKPGTFPKEGKAELKDGGKGGLVTIQGQFSLILGTILVLAFLFLQFFPDQANDLFFKVV